MIKAYIDESGDLGKNEGYFIIAMVIAHKPNRLKNIAKDFCAYNKMEEIHTCKLSFVQKQYLINKISKQNDYSVAYIIADKMMIKKDKLFESNNLLFNYLFSFLVKDIIKANTDDIHLNLDNRTIKVSSMNSLIDYIKVESYGKWGFTNNINIEYHCSKQCKVVQIADFVASCIRRKYLYGTNDFYSKLNIVKSINFPYKTFRESLNTPLNKVDKL